MFGKKNPPLPLYRTPLIPAKLGLPLAAPSTLNFKYLRVGREQDSTFLTLAKPHSLQAPQFSRNWYLYLLYLNLLNWLVYTGRIKLRSNLSMWIILFNFPLTIPSYLKCRRHLDLNYWLETQPTHLVSLQLVLCYRV